MPFNAIHFTQSKSCFSSRSVLSTHQFKMAAITSSTLQIKLPPCTFLLDRAQQQTHVEWQENGLKISDIFLGTTAKNYK